ncbi:MAG: hypothetical protein RLZZ526_1329 [Actinomycetota bacterium]|jgi:hypothetical protein
MAHRIRKTIASAAIGATLVLGAGSTAFAAGDGSSRLVNLTTQQETCLASAKSAAKGATKDVRRATIKSAAQACGIWKRFSKLSSEQQACLAANGLKKPAGLPTKAQRKQLRSLAATCGVTIKVKG